MKKLITLLSITFVLTGLTTQPATADILYCQGMVCSTTPPDPKSFATFAAVDSQGVVQNIIVCSIANCPAKTENNDPNCANCNLVQQTPAGVTAGFRSSPETPVTYNNQTQTFNKGSDSFPAPVTRAAEVVDTSTVSMSSLSETTTVSAIINSNVVTFSPNSVVDNQMQFTPVVTSTTGASISATQGTTNETQSFTSPQTKEQVTAVVVNKPLITRYLNKVFILLRGWILD